MKNINEWKEGEQGTNKMKVDNDRKILQRDNKISYY